MTRTVLSRSWVRTALVPSSLPSSTTTISRSMGSSTDRIRRTISATVLRSLKTGTMTDSVRYRGSAVSSLMPPSLTFSPEPVVGEGETFAEVDLGAPAEHVCRKGDVGPAPHGVVDGERLEDDLGTGSGDLEHGVGELEHGELVRVADVHRTGPVGVEEGEDAAHLVGDVAVRPRLRSVAVDREGLAFEGLDQEVRDDAPVAGPQARPEGIEDAHDLDVEVVRPVIRHGHRLGEALRLVVHAAGTHRVDVTPVLLVLRVDLRVAVDLARGREQVPGAGGLGETEGVVRPERADLEGLDRILEVVARARRAGEVQDGVNAAVDREELRDVVLFELERGRVEEVLDVLDPAREQAVDGEDVPAASDERAAEVRAQEPCASGDDGAGHQRRSPS